MGSQLGVFEETLALLVGHAAAAPVLLVLEDLHWADTSTLDLVVFLAHNLAERPVVLLATCRRDEPSSKGRMTRLADGVRRSGSGLVLDLGPLAPGELTALLGPAPAALAAAIVARSGGNPFFAEELLAAGESQTAGLPHRLRDLLLQRVERLDPAAQDLLRLAAAAGRDVGYPLLRALAAVPEPDVRGSLRQAVEHEVLVADQAAGTFRFRHPLLAEAVYSTILPGEREELHARLAGELARTESASPAELAPHWAAAGRTAEALTASVEAARQAEAVFGLAEAVAHLERALALWSAVPGAAALTGLDLAGLCSWAAGLTSQTGASPRAAELARRAIELTGDQDPARAALLHVDLGVYSYANGSNEAGLAAFERAVELAPPSSAERAHALAAFGTGLQMAWRHEESLVVCEQALALARETQAQTAELRALTVLGSDLAYLGRGDEGLARLGQAVRLAGETGDPMALQRAYILPGDLPPPAAADAAPITPNAAGWHLLARAEHERARGAARPQAWADAAAAWERLERPPLAAYCRWRQTEALVGAGASRAEASVPLRDAHAVAARIGARPLTAELELLAQRARLDLAPPDVLPDTGAPGAKRALEELLGLTPREADVLALVARGYTNREIASTLVISVKTAGVHVSHILRKLDAPNRLEAAAIAHRLAPPHPELSP